LRPLTKGVMQLPTVVLWIHIALKNYLSFW
jgi:hypothetical protein